MRVVYEDMGEMFKAPFRFLPYCPGCNAELSTAESPCRKCGHIVEWFEPNTGKAKPNE